MGQIKCLPILTLSRISADDSLIRPNSMMVRAFDGIKTSACEDIDLKVPIGPCELKIPIVVIDIPVIFNLLLGHLWIHSVGAILSSLLQKVKFILGNKLITVMVEEDIPMPVATMILFINTQQLHSTSKYHSFEFISRNYILEAGDLLELKLWKTELMMGRYLMKKQYEPGTGLGKYGEGIT